MPSTRYSTGVEETLWMGLCKDPSGQMVFPPEIYETILEFMEVQYARGDLTPTLLFCGSIESHEVTVTVFSFNAWLATRPFPLLEFWSRIHTKCRYGEENIVSPCEVSFL